MHRAFRDRFAASHSHCFSVPNASGTGNGFGGHYHYDNAGPDGRSLAVYEAYYRPCGTVSYVEHVV